MTIPNRKTMIVAGFCVVIVASIAIGYAMSGPGRADVSVDAVQAADRLRKEVSGTSDAHTQPVGENGLPVDAQGDPTMKPGRVVTTKKK